VELADISGMINGISERLLMSFYHEGEGSRFFGNVGTHLPKYMMSHRTKIVILIFTAVRCADVTKLMSLKHAEQGSWTLA
jgi:hypothetical protein